MTTFYDTHAHLDFPDYASDLPEVIARAEAAGITRMVCIGTDLASSEQAIALSAQYPAVFAVVGWHPSHALEAPEDVAGPLRQLARHPKVVAIGETGLDYHRLPSAKERPEGRVSGVEGCFPGGTVEEDLRYKERQADLFKQQLEVAAEFGLNCVIHQRDAFDDTLSLLEPFANRVRGVFHCFANDPASMERIVGLGSIVSFTGIVTFKNGQNIRDTLAATPLEKFMLETDCPYLAPVPYRGKRCEPAYVKEIAACVAEVKGCNLEELSQATSSTARQFFPKLK